MLEMLEMRATAGQKGVHKEQPLRLTTLRKAGDWRLQRDSRPRRYP